MASMWCVRSPHSPTHCVAEHSQEWCARYIGPVSVESNAWGPFERDGSQCRFTEPSMYHGAHTRCAHPCCTIATHMNNVCLKCDCTPSAESESYSLGNASAPPLLHLLVSSTMRDNTTPDNHPARECIPSLFHRDGSNVQT